MNPQQPQQPIWNNLAALPEWLTFGRHPVPNGGFPTPATGSQQLPTGFHAGMASNTQLSPQSPSGMLPLQPGMATRGDTQAVPPHAIPHNAAFPAPPRAFAGAPTRRLPYGQHPAANYAPPPPPSQPRPGVRNTLPMPLQGMQQQFVQAPIVPSQGPVALAGVAPPLYHGQMHRAPQGYYMQPRQTHAPQVQPMYAPPPGPPPGWQGRAQTRYAPPPGPPPGWTATPPLPPSSVQMPQHQAQLPPSRDQSASPWIRDLFAPSPVVSTAATTPALRPSPAVGSVTLPFLEEVARSVAPYPPGSDQRVGRGNGQSAAPVQVVKPTLKRRIADADAGACEPGRSKRTATDASVQARSSQTDTTGRQVQTDNIYLPSQHAHAGPQRDAAPTQAAPKPDPTTSHESPQADPIVDESDASSLFGDEDMDDTALAMELALALGQEDVPAAASDDADALFEDDAALAMELALALGQDDAHVVSNRDIEPAAAAFELCLPGTDPIPERGVTRSGPAGHLPSAAPASTASAPLSRSKREGKKPARTAPPHPSASNGATSSAPPGAPAKPPSAPGNKGKSGAKKKKVSAPAAPSTAAGPSTDKRTQQRPSSEEAAAEHRAGANRAMLVQDPERGRRYAWMNDAAGPSSAARVHAPSEAAAPAPMVFNRLPPYHGPAGRHPPLEEGRSYPTCQYGPVEKPYWCLICWEKRKHRTYWHDAMTLREHIRKSHPDLLHTDVWKHAGM